MDIFYHALNYTSKGIIDATCLRAFKRKSAEETNQLIEDLAKCNYRAPSETLGNSSTLRGGGVIKMNRMTAIEAKLYALRNKLGNQDGRMHSVHEVGIVEGSEQKSIIDEGFSHEGPYQVEEAQFVGRNRIYNFKPNANLSTHYTPILRNHGNFSNGGKAQQEQRPI